MCLFPLENTNNKSIAYKKGLKEFMCGRCPECLSKRASEWSLRCTAQARESRAAVMVTLTYDTYKYDKIGNIIGENVSDMRVNKRDCQLFMKRLREYFDRKKGVKDIKYLITAEYGKRTGRAHYHALLFNVEFDDLIPYKKSKRGNRIYKSPTLTRLWNNGICTVDSINVTGAIARYCTKYCVKDYGIDDTFMLCSHGIGINELLRTFNGLSYWLDGKEKPIPRAVWNKWIMQRYEGSWSKQYFVAEPTYKYVNSYESYNDGKIKGKSYSIFTRERHKQNIKAREIFRRYRDNNPVYKAYLEYWKNKIDKELEKSVVKRVSLLDDKKYHNYKTATLNWLSEYKLSGYSKYQLPKRPRFEREPFYVQRNVWTLYEERKGHLPLPPRLIRANDRKKDDIIFFEDDFVCKNQRNRKFERKFVQNPLEGIDI